MTRDPIRRADQSGGAISLWVVLMVPVAAFAAVVAMAGPQRMAAESSMEEAAGDLATLAVVLRDGRDNPDHELEGFLPDCLPLEVADLTNQAEIDQRDGLEDVCRLLLGDDTTAAEGYLHRDLGYLGINTNSWEGFYSNSVISDPCEISATRQTKDAVYVALAADWEDAGWAAAQAWPDGVRLGDELVVRLNLAYDGSSPLVPCVSEELAPPPGRDSARTVFLD